MSLISGHYKRISIDNFSAYLDKIGVTEAKKKIALKQLSFSNFISQPKPNQVKIVTEIQYGVDIGTATTETWYVYFYILTDIWSMTNGREINF